MKRARILVTGPFGRVGTVITPLLREHFDLHLLDRMHPQGTVDRRDEFFQADVQDIDAIRKASEGVAAVLHLAAVSDEDDFRSRLLPINVDGVYSVFEAARLGGVSRVIFFSTGQTVLHNGRGTWVTPAMPARPWTIYACTKIFGEALGRYYADHHGMSVICIRLGWFQNYDCEDLLAGRGHPREWCSPRDLVQLLVKSIQSEVRYAIFFGVSNNTGRYWDISNAQELVGYDPEDDATKVLNARPAVIH